MIIPPSTNSHGMQRFGADADTSLRGRNGLPASPQVVTTCTGLVTLLRGLLGLEKGSKNAETGGVGGSAYPETE